jgi:hypothetical protein
MKKIIKIIGLSLLMSAFTQTTSAQIEAGKKLVGASSNLGFNSNSQGGQSSSQFTINASGGIFFTEKIAGGADFGFSSWSANGSSFLSSFNVGGFGRYYINKFYPEVTIGIFNSNNGYGTTTNLYYGAGVGYAIIMNDYISIDPKLNYTVVQYDGGSSNGFGINVGFSLYF